MKYFVIVVCDFLWQCKRGFVDHVDTSSTPTTRLPPRRVTTYLDSSSAVSYMDPTSSTTHIDNLLLHSLLHGSHLDQYLPTSTNNYLDQ